MSACGLNRFPHARAVSRRIDPGRDRPRWPGNGPSLGAVDLQVLREIAGYVSIAAEAIRIGEDLRRAQLELRSAQSEDQNYG